MLFQVTLLAKLAAQPLLSAVLLTPQLKAADEDGAREALDHWLEKTGYAVAPGNEPSFKELDDSGLPPDLAAVNALADENADLKQRLADSGSDELQSKVDALSLQLAKAQGDFASAEQLAADYKAKCESLVGECALAKQLAQDEAQRAADKDSDIATLKAQLEEALRPAVVHPPTVNPELAASSPVPADGSTPAP